jgi:integrase
MSKVLSLAVYPGRYIPSNPIPREWMPKIPKSANKAKTFLYPEEDAKLLGCAAVLIERRMAYGILAREGMRASELAALRWRDLDLQHGRVRLDANKTDDPRAWALSPDVAAALAWWKKRTGGGDRDLVLGGLDLSQGPRWLRGKAWALKTRHKDEIGDLRTAGVTRPELFERSKSRQPIRLHDLRATFVTVSLANGKTEQWVSDRTGHKSSQMIATYARQARTWSELDLGTLGTLDGLLPEMRGATSSSAGKPADDTGGRRRRAPATARPQRSGGVAAHSSPHWAANGQQWAPQRRL